jgi:outer membrane receptor protein involved in Fe transport
MHRPALPTRANLSRPAFHLSLLTLLASAPLLLAQTAAPTSHAAAAARATDPDAVRKQQQLDEAAVLLSIFEVKTDAADTYDATNTNSVTGTNTPLNKTPLDAKVFNRQLMDELGVVDMTEMLWKLGGLGPAVINAGEDVRGTLEGDRQDPKSMTMRGLQINNPRRDGFLRSDTTLLDSFDIDRVEAIGGSNSLLFGSGDAGGVITSTSKRAYLNRRPTVTFSATGDSEGTRRYTADAQAGEKVFALRFNWVKSDVGTFRPGLNQQARGYHIAATFQPFKRLQIRGEFRSYSRDTIFAQAVTIRAPLTLLLPNGTRVDNQNSRYVVAFPNASELTGGQFDLTKVDSAIGPYHRDAYFNQLKSVVAEATLAEGLALQLRYGHDSRVNDALRASNTTVYAPGAAGNNYVDPVTNQVGTQWSMNQSIIATPFWTGARGYRAALAYQKDLGKWGRHQSNLFHQDMWSWTNQQPWRFYELDGNGRIIQNLALINNAESGRNVMPATWMRTFPAALIGGNDWRFNKVTLPNGKTYQYAPQVYANAVPKTAGNPLGLSGGVNAATGNPSNTTYTMDDTRETSYGASLFSEWWRGKIDTMLGYRVEEATGYRNHLGLSRGPISYDSLTTGLVADTPIKDLRFTASYSTNAKINFDTTRDIFNQTLPAGKGVSRDLGFKFDLFQRRISGNVNYYQSEAKNFTTTLGNRDDIDPPGINGRNGGNAFTYSKKSDGYNLTLTSRPLRMWEIRVNVATANGAERSDVILPQFYNDQFNTISVNGETAVGVKAPGSSTVTPLMVPSDPRNPASAQIPLTLSMMKDPSSAYRAVLDPESGYIINAQALGLLTPGVGTQVTGLPISQHQLGFVSPSGGTLIVRKAGEKSGGFPERSYSIVNRFQFTQGLLRNFVFGLNTSYQQNYRAYMYTDVADASKRKMFYFPDRTLHDVFVTYSFRPTKRLKATIRMNITNVLDTNRVLYLLNSTNGTLRYAQWFNAPRKLAVTSVLSF